MEGGDRDARVWLRSFIFGCIQRAYLEWDWIRVKLEWDWTRVKLEWEV